jgi:hypothetical protein
MPDLPFSFGLSTYVPFDGSKRLSLDFPFMKKKKLEALFWLWDKPFLKFTF